MDAPASRGNPEGGTLLRAMSKHLVDRGIWLIGFQRNASVMYGPDSPARIIPVDSAVDATAAVAGAQWQEAGRMPVSAGGALSMSLLASSWSCGHCTLMVIVRPAGAVPSGPGGIPCGGASG